MYKGQAYDVSIAGEARLAAAEDAGRLRDALGVPVSLGLLSLIHI